MTVTKSKKKPAPKRAKKKAAKKKVAKKIRGKSLGIEVNGFPVFRFKAGELSRAAAPYNPRTITEKALGGLKNSVGKFGLVEPIIWNKKSGNLVGGHQRLKTLSEDADTDVIVVDLDEKDEKALNLALNNPHTAGEWSSKLGELLNELQVDVPELTMDLNLDELRVDIPVELEDLIGEHEEVVEEEDFKKDVKDKAENWQASEVRQIILLLTLPEYEEAVGVLDKVMEDQNVESHTAAMLWLIRNYGE